MSNSIIDGLNLLNSLSTKSGEGRCLRIVKQCEALDSFQEELDELEGTFQAAVGDFMSALGPITDRLPDLYAEIRQALNIISVDLDDYPFPDPKEADEPNGVLFDSARTYADQLIHYKAYRNGHDTPTR